MPDPLWWARGLRPAEPIDRPTWAEHVERAVWAAPEHASPGLAAAEPAPAGRAPETAEEVLAPPLLPFVIDARDRMRDQIAPVIQGHAVDVARLAEDFAAGLSPRLVRIAARTIVVELSLQRRRGLLTGSDGRQRFADFIERLARPAGLAALFAKYPVLARLLAEAAAFAVEAHVELVRRYVADRRVVIDALLGGADPGPLVAVRTRLGDAHRGGRAVAVLVFADGRQVVYKPRGLDLYLKLGEFVAWLNWALPDIDLRTAATIPRDGYGWTEFVPRLPVPDVAAGERFYRRTGVLLALLHVVRAVDIHCENLIAYGEQPVLVDAEMLLHPNLPVAGSAGDPAAAMLAASVVRTGLLPLATIGDSGIADYSGLGGDHGIASVSTVVTWDLVGTDEMRMVRRCGTFAGALNRPQIDHRDLDPRDYEGSLREGFRLGYDAIVHGRRAFQELLDGSAGHENRIGFRATRTYAMLLDRSTHPAVLRQAVDRDHVFDELRHLSVGDRARQRLLRHEVDDMWRGDVPFFTSRPAERDVYASSGERLPDLLACDGLSAAAAVVAAMDAADRRDQEWVISATLATRHPVDDHRDGAPLSGRLLGRAAGSGRLLAAACALGDQIVARGIATGKRVNWPGLEVVDDTRWMVLPMGAALSNGYLGVALFLAQLATLTGISRYRDTALRAAGAAAPLCESLVQRPDLAAAVGCGGFHGLGGLSYSLARLTTLLGEAELRHCTETTVAVAAQAVRAPNPPGVASGTAGCLAAMVAVHAELGLSAAAEVASTCAEQLVATAGGADCLPAGFADGDTGISWALSLFHRTGISEAADSPGALLEADQHDRRGYGWCSGAAGLVAAQGSWGSDVAVERLARMFADRPVLRDLSLCHGELGITEALVVLARANPRRSALRVLHRRAGLVLDAIERYGPGCGTPGGVPTPGLFNGLAGIGYGLLRLGFPDRVPSVLLLEPTCPTALSA